MEGLARARLALALLGFKVTTARYLCLRIFLGVTAIWHYAGESRAEPLEGPTPAFVLVS